MTFGWPEVPIGEVATPVERFEAPVPGEAYRQAGVRLWGAGAYEREPVDGGDTKYKSLNRTKHGDIIVNKIWARNGSVSVILNGLDGCYVSGEFPLFMPAEARLESKWFYWITRTRWFWHRCDVQSRGTSGKNRIRPDQFLAIPIPLPPLDEQRRIVAKIEHLAAKIDEVHGLRHESIRMIEALPARAAARAIVADVGTSKPLGELLREKSRNGLSARPSDDPVGYPILRISAGTSRSDGVVNEADHKYLEVTEKEFGDYRLEAGDLLACRFNGNLHYVGRFSLYTGETGQVHLHPDKLIRFRVDHSQVSPEYIRAIMNSPYGREKIEAFCQTTAGNIGISAKNLNSIAIPVLNKKEQLRIVTHLDSLQAKVDRLKALQKKTAAELDALLPSILDKAFKGDL